MGDTSQATSELELSWKAKRKLASPGLVLIRCQIAQEPQVPAEGVRRLLRAGQGAGTNPFCKALAPRPVEEANLNICFPKMTISCPQQASDSQGLFQEPSSHILSK